MKTKMILATIAVILAMPALAEYTLIAEGSEVALSDVRLPRDDGGTISYKPCRECDYRTVRVAADVRWVLNGQRVSLREFRRRIELISNHERRPMTVRRHIESNQVTEVIISVRDLD